MMTMTAMITMMMMSVSDWNMPDDKPGLVKALKVDVRHELDGVVLV